MLQVQSTMVNTALAFEFMNADAPSVDTSFTYVNDRIRRVLSVSQDPFPCRAKSLIPQ